MGGLAASVSAVGALGGTAAAVTTKRGIEFDRVVDVVDDLGLDPTGNDPVQKKLENAEQEGTLFVFPEGEYLITERLLVLYNDTVGMVGRGNARFVVPENYNQAAVIMDRGRCALFENIDLDLRADGATPGLKFGAHEKAEVHDVELIGQGIHPRSDPRGEGNGNPGVTYALHLVAHKKDANVVVENFVARNKGLMGAYNHGNGRNGVWIGQSNVGTVTMRNCHFSGFPNNGLYTSRTPGVVQVEGGVFRNNDVAQVRLGSEGSYVEGALIEVDPSKSESPNPEDMLNGRGVRIESGPIKTAGVTVRDCDIRIAEDANSGGGIIAPGSGGRFDVVDTRIKVDARGARGVYAKSPYHSGSYAPPQPCRVRLKNVSITGSADRGEAIRLDERPNSLIDSCCIEHTGEYRGGVTLVDSGNDVVVKNSTLNVPGRSIQSSNTNVNQWGNSDDGSCPLPATEPQNSAGIDAPEDSESGSSDDGESGGDEPTESDDSSGSDSEMDKRVVIRGNENGVTYSIEVSGEIRRTEKAEGGDVASGSKASGKAGKWADAFEYTGTIRKLVVEGDATFVYDGTSNHMAFRGNRTGDVLSYSGEVDNNFWLNSSTSEEDQPVSTDRGGERASGTVGGWKDTYGCTGDLVAAEIEGVLSVDIKEVN